MPERTYKLTVLRRRTVVRELSMALDLGKPAAADHLRRILVNAVRDGRDRDAEVVHYAIEVREANARRLAIPPFTATTEQIRGM